MFDLLPESGAHRETHLGQTSLSIAAHVVLVAAALELTRAAASAVHRNPEPIDAVFIRPPVAEPARATRSSSAAPVASPIRPAPAIPAITITGVQIAPVDVTPRTGPPPVGRSIPGTRVPFGPSNGIGDSVRSAAEVDEPATYLSGPDPEYPATLRRLAIEGSVRLRYIVSAAGRAEPGPIAVLASTNPMFEAPAVAAIAGSRFNPARVRGAPVRQLVEQLVRFTLR